MLVTCFRNLLYILRRPKLMSTGQLYTDQYSQLDRVVSFVSLHCASFLCIVLVLVAHDTIMASSKEQ
jgi:hypothetical protein